MIERYRAPNIDRIVAGLGGRQANGKCFCPAHHDKNTANLGVTERGDKVLVKCWAGCAQDDVLDALRSQGLWPAKTNSKGAAYAPTVRSRKNTSGEKDTTKLAHEILKVAAKSKKKPTEYLRRRGIELVPDCVSLISRTEAVKLGLRRFPHIVVPIVNERGEQIGAQTTALTLDAKEKVEANKSARLTYGHMTGGCVVLAAPDPDRPLIVGEGVETVLSAMQITGLPGIATLGTANLKTFNPPACAEVIVAADNGVPGCEAAEALAQLLIGSGRKARIATPPMPGGGKSGYDWNDALVAADDANALRPAILEAPLFAASADKVGGTAADRINAIALLDDLVYEQQRKRKAKDLGVRVEFLDQEREKLRDEQATEKPLYPHWEVEPWPEPVDTGELLSEVEGLISRYVATLGDRAIVPALWVIWSWAHDTATHSPLLLATSAEPDSGKTTLAGVVGFLTRRALLSVSITSAILFRVIERWAPTLVIDEADTVLADNEDIKAIVNGSWTRGQTVLRCDPNTNEVRGYSIFTPKMLAMKKTKGRIALPDTTLSRSIVLELKRKVAGEPVADFNHLDNDDFARARCKRLRWATDNADIHKAEPVLPGFDNRLRMNWRGLFAIAELAGVQERTRKAALRIEGAKDETERALTINLLMDIRAIFDEEDDHRVLSRDLLDRLIVDPEKPWAEFSRGKPLTQKNLARLLGTYKIYSREVNPTGKAHGKGYTRAQFEDAWNRYLTPAEVPPAVEGALEVRTGVNQAKSMAYDEGEAHETDESTRFEPLTNPLKTNVKRGRADENRPSSRAGGKTFLYQTDVAARRQHILKNSSYQ